MLPGYVVPGQIICPFAETTQGSAQDSTPKYEAGCGVELTPKGLKSTVLGQLAVEPATGRPGVHTINVVNKFNNPYSRMDPPSGGNSQRSTSRLPQVGDVVYGQVSRLGQNQVHLELLVAENKGELLSDSGVGWSANSVGTVHQAAGTLGDLAELGEGYGAVIRTQDVRATERDKIRLEECFHPGDIVRASVISIGDGSNYYLSTIRNDLGVVFAKSADGQNMIPLDWQTMVVPGSNETESRKCANPFVGTQNEAQA